ncbi:recombination protein NinG [Pseudomonas costantinii]|uniref:NinG protein n=1 Tax=Pseudomonas costantinii TaxID=168469 RepID=A0A1S2UDP1_9PSED|nr:recombination protein NinG [Pseudomonas costantinii]OIN44537.1 ninG protein [Pseudomonas costantinii]SED27078.1 Bacteriophage Lambda NinG protein [Pseudomonas costantinii]
MSLPAKQPRPKTCKNPACGEKFVAQRLGQAVCSPKCGLAIKHVNEDKARKSLDQVGRADIRVRKQALKTRADHMRDAQKAFNEFIRVRDQLAGHPCISSGRPLDWAGNAVDAGHYRSVGAAPHLRFDERNCHAQSKQDNRYLSGNAIDYRIGLIKRIGRDEVELLEADQSVRKYTIEDLKAITAEYRAKTRELKKGQVA